LSVAFQTLLELVDYVNSAKQPFVEQIMPEVVAMVCAALLLPPPAYHKSVSYIRKHLVFGTSAFLS
jgi:uncharacterized membrane protein YjgN (DUF898 family)